MKITSQNRTSDAYRFTVEMKDGRPVGSDAAAVAELRQLVKQTNKIFSDKMYVKLQGRGPRAEQSRRDYGYSRGYDQGLPLTLSTRADVYVYTR